MSLNEQYNMEQDSVNMGKVWFRTVRNIPVGMTEKEQLKAARDPRSVVQESRRVVVTVQTAAMEGRRYNSAVDMSSMLSVELYDPKTSLRHTTVVDADDVHGKRWQQHVRSNECVQMLVSHLRMHHDYHGVPGGATVGGGRGGRGGRGGHVQRGPCVGLGPAVECYHVKMTTHPRDIHYCRRSSLLPWACGSGSELYTSLKWKEDSPFTSATAKNYAKEKPRPLFRGTRLLYDYKERPYRVLVSAWREISKER